MEKLLTLVIVSLFILSCKKDVRKAVINNKKEIIIDTAGTQKKNLGDFHIFDLYALENGSNYDIFISLSDIYNDSLSIPSEIIQNQKTKTFADLKHFELKGIYREKLLKGTSLSETDSLFLYNYKEAKLQKFPISDLKAVANLNLYASEGDDISYYDYMIGFQLNQSESSESYTDKTNFSLAYFGKESPFSGEKLIPIHWKKTSREQFPLSLKNQQITGNTYHSKYKNLDYYLQDYNGENETSKRQLAVLKDNKVIFTRDFTTGEGAEFTSLNFVDHNEYNEWQWTGNLFKNKPPVIFGFVSESFGCESITFLDSSFPALYTNCDNRH